LISAVAIELFWQKKIASCACRLFVQLLIFVLQTENSRSFNMNCYLRKFDEEGVRQMQVWRSLVVGTDAKFFFFAVFPFSFSLISARVTVC
jgi:hypothetical protein